MRKAVFSFILFWFTLVVYGQNHPKTLLWKVTKPGSKKESFLFGTFHEVSPAFFHSLSIAVSKLEQADILFVEERIAASKVPALDKKPHWSSRKWNAILPKEQAQIFSEFVKKAEDTSYYSLNPLLLTLTTARLYLTNFCGSDTSINELMDHSIEKLAIKQNKKIYSLDSNQNTMLKNEAENFNFLQDSLYASYSIHFMKSMLANDLEACQIVSLYKNFDLNYELDTDLTRSSSSSSLLIERNQKWIRTLHEAFSSNNCFVAVGFRHLFYKQGLIQQLKKLGYSVTPVQMIK